MINKDILDTLLDLEREDMPHHIVFPVMADADPSETFEIAPSDRESDYLLLPLRNMVLLPGLSLPIVVGRERSRRIVQEIERSGQAFVVAMQRDATVEDPQFEDLHTIGVLAKLDRIMELPDETLTIFVRGFQRIRLVGQTSSEPHMRVHGDLLVEEFENTENFEVLMQALQENYLEYIRLTQPNIPKSLFQKLKANKNNILVVSNAINALGISASVKQELLDLDLLSDRAVRTLQIQQKELKLLEIREELLGKAQQEIDKQQKEYFIQQQIKVFQEELGSGPGEQEINELRTEAKTKKWSNEIAEVFERELRKAERLNVASPDYAIQMQYLRNIVSLPWGEYSQDNFNLKRAQRNLNKDHYGLDKVKERILEHLAVLKLKGDMKSPIICLYGPPGVGKTSLGKSIAESLGRRYVRISLGGVHDEAEIRGHRRTYIGAMSGRIIQALQKAGTSNPVFVLDEIDKLSDSYKGDPQSALLEVLDPEQNTAFHDNYLDIDYDLSKVLFIATANNVGAMSQPLRDRMELIEVSGYLSEEKLQIAKKHLIPKAIEEHGLQDYGITFSTKAIQVLIEDYTRESGVRGLTKRISDIMRKIAWQVAGEGSTIAEVTPELVREYLGKPRYTRDKYQGNEFPGVVVGLAWTSVGGEILFIESSLHAGSELKLNLTGSLGDVMKESAAIALAFVKAHKDELGISADRIKDKEVHIHVPEGATPKDGPSAGITMLTSLVSVMTGRKVKAHLAMTGELTLSGRVLPVGGIKEKILAAKRSGIKEIILCKENEKDIQEIHVSYLKGLTFHYVQHAREVLRLALTDEIVQ